MQLTRAWRLGLCVAALVLLAACGGGGKGSKNGGGPAPAKDSEAPRIVSTVPSQSASNVDPATTITINFNETIAVGNATIVLRVGNTQVATAVTASGSTLSVQLNSANVEGNATLSLAGR